jgi:hypothetical protein
MRNTLKTALAVMLLGGTGAATAQADGSALAGRWVGEMSEPGADITRYEIRLSFGTDRHGVPVGMVHYDALHCGGVWTPAEGFPAGARFEEVITDDAGVHCAPQNDVEVSLTERGLNLRFMEPGRNQVIATATLRRVH